MHPTDFDIYFSYSATYVSYLGSLPETFFSEPKRIPEEKYLQKLACNEDNYDKLKNMLKDKFDIFLEIYKNDISFSKVAKAIDFYIFERFYNECATENFVTIIHSLLSKYSEKAFETILNLIPLYILSYKYDGHISGREAVSFVGDAKDKNDLVVNSKAFLKNEIEALYTAPFDCESDKYWGKYHKVLQKIDKIEYKDLDFLTFQSSLEKEIAVFKRISFTELLGFSPNDVFRKNCNDFDKHSSFQHFGNWRQGVGMTKKVLAKERLSPTLIPRL